MRATDPRRGEGRTVQLRLLGLLSLACLLAACGDAGSDETGDSTDALASTTVQAASTTAARSTGNYNVTPLRSDGQRVIFRITLADGVTGEVSLAPADTAIESVGPRIELMRPGNVAAGGGDIFTTRADDRTFATFCASTLGGVCKPRTTEDLSEGIQYETYGLAAGGTIGRVVFGQWAVIVNGRDVADAFTFRIGPDGFPLVSPRTTGWSTSAPSLTINASRAARYLMRSDPSGSCGPAPGSRTHCDRGLSVEALSTSPDASVKRIN
jgi:hypothetical protein